MGTSRDVSLWSWRERELGGEEGAEGYGWLKMSGMKHQEWKGNELEVHARPGDPGNQRVRGMAVGQWEECWEV